MSIEPSEVSDEHLMQELQKGDDLALAGLMQRWEVPVKRFIYRLVGNSAEAEDLAQEVFVRVYTKRASYRTGARFSSWVLSIAANQAKNRLRWWKRRPTLSLNEWVDLGGDTEDAETSQARRTEKEEAALRIEAVQAAIAELSVPERTAIVLFEYENKSMAEMALILECTPKAVENRLYRARRNLAKVLRPL